MWVGVGLGTKKMGAGSCRGTKKMGFGRAAAENFGFSRFKRRFGSFGERKREGEGRFFFARLRRGPLLSKSVVFMYCNPKIEVSIFWIFISVGGGGWVWVQKKWHVLTSKNKKTPPMGSPGLHRGGDRATLRGSLPHSGREAR